MKIIGVLSREKFNLTESIFYSRKISNYIYNMKKRKCQNSLEIILRHKIYMAKRIRGTIYEIYGGESKIKISNPQGHLCNSTADSNNRKRAD